MDKYIFNETNFLWYELTRNYDFPCMIVPAEEEQPVGVRGQKHRQYLKEYHPALYNALLLGVKLNSYLVDIDQRAQELFDTIIQQMAYAQCVTETQDGNCERGNHILISQRDGGESSSPSFLQFDIFIAPALFCKRS